ncbi:MAG: glycosyltransferase family 4 protein [Candidatus Falkowbacteria bacterium]
MRIAYIGQKGIFVRAGSPSRDQLRRSETGGVETHVENLSLQLAEKGHDIFVYCRPHFCFIRRKKYLGVNLIKLPSIPTKNLDTITHVLISTIHALFKRYDIIHYHGVGPATLAWIPRLLKPRTKVVVTFHSIDRLHQKWNWFAKKYLRFGEWAACKFPHETIVVSKMLQKYCKKNFGRQTIYLPNGVLMPRKPRVEPIRKWGLKPNEYILAVSRLVRHKGMHYLIHAYREIVAQGLAMTKGAKLLIVGAPSHTEEYFNELKSMAVGDENIIFAGYQRGEALRSLFGNCYFFVHPSESEGLAITVLEAMSFGKCALVSDIPENLEAIGKSGVSFKSTNVKDLREKMEALLKNPEKVKKIGVRAKLFIKRNYEWSGIVKKLEKFYVALRPGYAERLRQGEEPQGDKLS